MGEQYYVVNGERYESHGEALERAHQIARQRDDERARRGEQTTSATLAKDTVQVLREDGTVSATVRP